MDTFLTAERERDAEEVVRLLAPDFYMYVDGVRQGYDSVAAQIRATMPALQRMEPTWDDVEVNALGPNHALVTFTFRDLIVDAPETRSGFAGRRRSCGGGTGRVGRCSTPTPIIIRTRHRRQ